MVVCLHIPVLNHIYDFEVCVVCNLEGRILKITVGNNFFGDYAACFEETYKISYSSEELYLYDTPGLSVNSSKYFTTYPIIIELIEKSIRRVCDDFDLCYDLHHSHIRLTDGMETTVLTYTLW